MAASSHTYVAYKGSSMEPLFNPGDILQVIPYAGNKIRCGDVIFYSCPSQNCSVVHRVKACGARGIRTKGDNNRRADPRIVQPHQVVGYVAYALSGQRWRRIRGGYIGSYAVKGARALERISAWARLTRSALHARSAVS